jgi:quercetin dioxygenase-like cupin family protein
MVNNINDLDGKKIENTAAKNAIMKVLVGPKEGWDDYVMRVVELDKDGYSPKHSHPWPHINYVIEGDGYILMDGEKHKVSKGSYAFVPNLIEHQYVNTGENIFKFICIVPKEGHK